MSEDGGAAWTDAEVRADPGHPWAWAAWRTTWHATPGLRHLSVRATDAAGNTQPTVQRWNRGGFADNLVQRVEVLCAPEPPAPPSPATP